MEGIGIVLIILLAIASSINKRIARQRQANQQKPPQTDKPAKPEGAFQQAMRQFQEAMDMATGKQPEKKTPEKKSRAFSDIMQVPEHPGEPDFRGSMKKTEEAPFETMASHWPEAEMTPLGRAEERNGVEPAPQALASGSVLPQLPRNSLVQALVTHEILTRPRSAWRRKSTYLNRRSGA